MWVSLYSPLSSSITRWPGPVWDRVWGPLPPLPAPQLRGPCGSCPYHSWHTTQEDHHQVLNAQPPSASNRQDNISTGYPNLLRLLCSPCNLYQYFVNAGSVYSCHTCLPVPWCTFFHALYNCMLLYTTVLFSNYVQVVLNRIACYMYIE